MRFDWTAFCLKNQVAFVTRGPNTGRNRISIKCPYCGAADKSQHMGLSLDVKWPHWGCLRNSSHRGNNPRRLVQKLLGITYEEALRLVRGTQTADDVELSNALDALRADAAAPEQASQASERPLPSECRSIADAMTSPRLPGKTYARKFLDYVADRGFGLDAYNVCVQYDLHYALTGDQEWRVVFPIHDVDGNVTGWTGREIRDAATLRYRSCDNLPHTAVYNIDLAARSEADTLVIVEGPIDTAKMDYYGAEHGVTAVGTLGTALPSERVSILARLARRFDRVALLFDEGTLPEVLSLAPALEELSGNQVYLWRPGLKDPGAMTQAQIGEFIYHQMSPVLGGA